MGHPNPVIRVWIQDRTCGPYNADQRPATRYWYIPGAFPREKHARHPYGEPHLGWASSACSEPLPETRPTHGLPNTSLANGAGTTRAGHKTPPHGEVSSDAVLALQADTGGKTASRTADFGRLVASQDPTMKRDDGGSATKVDRVAI
jgi:hypothetical protein